jgi:hypothetical protein
MFRIVRQLMQERYIRLARYDLEYHSCFSP